MMWTGLAAVLMTVLGVTLFSHAVRVDDGRTSVLLLGGSLISLAVAVAVFILVSR